MAAPRTRPGNPERGWNDPPMFNFSPGQTAGQPRRMLNKRVAFPASGNPGSAPGHAVLNASQGPPILNPVLPAEVLGQPAVPQHPPVPIGPRDTPLGNQAPPTSPVQILPPSADSSTPQTVPVLVPSLVPASPPKLEDPIPPGETVTQLDNERIEELMSRLSLQSDDELLGFVMEKFESVLQGYKSILTTKACEEIKKKLELLGDRWHSAPLSDVVKVRLTQLAQALVEEQTEKANHLHLSLVVDHIAEVNQWIMGVKRLLQQQQLAVKEREIIQENKNSSEQSVSDNQTDKLAQDSQQNLGETTQQSRESTLTEDESTNPLPDKLENSNEASDEVNAKKIGEKVGQQSVGTDLSSKEQS